MNNRKEFDEVHCMCVKSKCTREGVCKECGKHSKITMDSYRAFQEELKQRGIK